MTDLPAPAGLVSAIHAVRTAGRTMVVYYCPATGYCRALAPNMRKPAGTVKVGSYSAAVLGQELARTIRADVERAVLAANVPRVSKNIHSESTTYHAGRRQ